MNRNKFAKYLQWAFRLRRQSVEEPSEQKVESIARVEAAIQDTLYGVMEGKTVIAIAHRLSTIAQMDRIVVLDAGRVAEEGSHAELLAYDGLYASFWNRQSGGFIGADA